ncbi:hypothetical protein CCAL9344_03600 [Campylobacter sp. RM9344]|uniref:Lipoprotein n=1 Tax=Campylobacter californiensis TaxID=1032243 RepID=A0AAW3ZWF1_9BACT|nr:MULTISPECIES: hypothetical protein [unclassified Campylobacter]MBE2985392.1 hypothetical protein [Campylobacter sp. RM6883]MBE2987159.1 hypothetical protein [Campylobacter sp. RM12919]MBE2987654.1 hypothetical protein [Campylobacter sp. RM12920]MBE2995972.1 hypothetical protein [Campylobacter sp. RM6913]MBE3022297.1 hypothetical protein [Campylobacter sp. 7477a]MBE3029279.1 hypothetical protein [Campylobacter sp. RM9344]
MNKFLKILLLMLIVFVFNGCIFLNERGISTQYYNDCKEYYDATGTYRKECPHNIIDWK